jgi:phosphopantothenoylcysteine decarboxylase/phosphopantothenate--cysteine ligase
MGFALAETAKKLGADVTLISGPVSLPTPHGIKRIDVVNTQQMYRETMKRFACYDVVIMAAAVSDFRIKKFSSKKIKRKGRKKRSIALFPNPDILEMMGKRKQPWQTIIGFALETDDLEKNALKKLKDKKCDWIVANNYKAIGSPKGRAILFCRKGGKIRLPELPKHELAMLILSHIFGAK